MGEPSRVEIHAPRVGILAQLGIVALPVHPYDNVADAAPAIEPRPQRDKRERWIGDVKISERKRGDEQGAPVAQSNTAF